MKKVTCTDRYSGQTYTVVEDITEEDRKELLAKTEKKLMAKAKSKKVREEMLRAYRNRREQ